MNITLKKLAVFFAFLVFGNTLSAQENLQLGQKLHSDNVKNDITIIKKNKTTSVKDQARTGTCWCFATISFLESELLRMYDKEYDLSEMFVVRSNYTRRILDNYYRQGKGNISEGSIAHMVIKAIKANGIVPEEVYSGCLNPNKGHYHGMMQKYIQAVSKVAVDSKRPLNVNLLNGIYDSHLGEVPSEFKYKGKKYNAQSFAKSLKLNLDDYVELTSFSHHPFNELVPLEIPDNWDHEKMYNVSLEDLMKVMDNAIAKGYTFSWDGDVSEEEFRARGIKVLYNGEKENGVVTQAIRQKGFERFVTTDDHLMHGVGLAKDSEGIEYYIIKNSWGPEVQDKGYLYMSKDYAAAKTVSILVHKDSIPKDVRKKLGL